MALVDHPSGDGIAGGVPYGVDALLHLPALHPSFPVGLVKAGSDFIVRLVEAGLEK